MAFTKKHPPIRCRLQPLVRKSPRPEASALFAALRTGNSLAVSRLLARGVPTDIPDDDGNLPIHVATTAGRFDLVELLIGAGAHIDATDAMHRTPLHLAAKYGAKNICLSLLGAGANPNAKDSQGRTPLHMAALEDRPDTVWLLLKAGANLREPDDSGMDPLSLAIGRGSASFAKTVLRLTGIRCQDLFPGRIFVQKERSRVLLRNPTYPPRSKPFTGSRYLGRDTALLGMLAAPPSTTKTGVASFLNAGTKEDHESR